MPQASGGSSSAAVSSNAPPSPSPSLVCAWKEGSYDACWLHLAGRVDPTTSLQRRYTLAEAQLPAASFQLHALLLVLDLRDGTTSTTVHINGTLWICPPQPSRERHSRT